MNADNLNIACSNFWMRLCAGGWGCRGMFCDEEMSMCDGTNSFWCEHGGSCEEIVQGEKYSCKWIWWGTLWAFWSTNETSFVDEFLGFNSPKNSEKHIIELV